MSGQSRAGAWPFRRAAGLLSICVVASAIAACGDQYNSIFRTARLDGPGGGDSLITDAKQRVIINVDNYRRGGGHRIICAEPSPDVAQATSTALEVSARLANTAGASKTDAAAGLALATAAQVAQLGERLATIQSIRERMYRACEAYANGATTQAQYRNMLATIDRLIATTLSAEMAAGAFGRNLAVASTSAAAGGDSALLRNLSADVKKSLEDYAEALKAQSPVPQDKLDKVKAQVDQLAAAQAAVAASATAGSASVPGAITGTRTTDAAAVVAIHRNYIDDERVESLVDACVSTLSEVRYSDEDYNKYLEDIEKRRQAIYQRYTRPPTFTEVLARRNPNDDMRADRERAIDGIKPISRKEFIDQRNAFATYCIDHVFGKPPQQAPGQTRPRATGYPAVAGNIAPFILHRMDAKERLRKLSQANLLDVICLPIIARAGQTDATSDVKVMAESCRVARSRAN